MTRLGVVAFVCAFGAHAAANPEAEKSFREGRRLMKVGQLVEACMELERSQRLDPKPGTLLNLGDCQEQRGQTATARESFLQAKALALQSGDKRREQEADRRVAALEPRLARLTLVVPRDKPIVGLVIRRNGVAIDPATWSVATPLDPGDYKIEVTAPGHRSWSRTQTLAPKQTATVVIEPLVAIGSDPLVPARGVAPAAVRELGVGVLVGASVQHESALIGARFLAAMEVPRGQLRGVGMFYFSRYPDEPETNPALKTDTFSIGVSAEYVWMPLPKLAFAGGFGIGVEYDAVNMKQPEPPDERVNDLGAFFSARVSPVIVRLRGGTIEAGMHVHVSVAGDEVIVLGIAGVDWFIW